ncbi:uncharacterized protein BYT42DRAFT_610083 [Radiomyces spectabilis]|uniref:uncharacterized protein n=1 Tax=Radiomyces spectabilis TaxID=64574 RepID=UPI00221F4411|nr:uncharacterized protein BYT42DRAFT_610083 [Radiomyces spectabilis]KAI8390804.1 hypothetical protein BYT42DRAFT_610083 [Radiomyces spectabilis]
MNYSSTNDTYDIVADRTQSNSSPTDEFRQMPVRSISDNQEQGSDANVAGDVLGGNPFRDEHSNKEPATWSETISSMAKTAVRQGSAIVSDADKALDKLATKLNTMMQPEDEETKQKRDREAAERHQEEEKKAAEAQSVDVQKCPEYEPSEGRYDQVQEEMTKQDKAMMSPVGSRSLPPKSAKASDAVMEVSPFGSDAGYDAVQSRVPTKEEYQAFKVQAEPPISDATHDMPKANYTSNSDNSNRFSTDTNLPPSNPSEEEAIMRKKYHVVDHKKHHGQSENDVPEDVDGKQARFDSDFENWRPPRDTS